MGRKGKRDPGDGQASPKRLRGQLRKADAKLARARDKRDRAQARVEALSIIADEIRATLAEVEKAVVVDKAGTKEPAATAAKPARSGPAKPAATSSSRTRSAVTTPARSSRRRPARKPARKPSADAGPQ